MTTTTHIIMYVLGAIVGVTLIYLLFTSSSNSSDTKTKGMYLVASLMALIIIFMISQYVYDSYNTTLSSEPWLVETTKNAQYQSIFPSDKIPLSTDGRFGIEFSYSFWIFINEWRNGSSAKSGEHHVLHKGDPTGYSAQCPGIWIAKDTNTLILRMNTFSDSTDCKGEDCLFEMCKIAGIPVHKWVHITISVINKNVDIYVNGFLKKRCLLKGLPRQNRGDVYMNAFGGFNGFMSRVRYFNYALQVWKIEQIIKQGPSDAPCEQTGETPPYLAYDWWQNKY